MSEGASVQAGATNGRTRLQPAVERSTLSGDDAGTVSAVQVSMERSGAEHIDAQRVTLQNSGARSLTTKTATLTNSGALKLDADSVEINQSSVVLAQAKDIRVAQSMIFVASAETATVDGVGTIGLLAAGGVQSSGDVRSTFMFAGNVKAGGDVKVMFDAVSAGALGAAFAAVLFALRRLVKR